jgi:hypothetical protein
MANASFASSSIPFHLDSAKAMIIGYNPEVTLKISLLRPVFIFDDAPPTSSIAPAHIQGDLASGKPVQLDYPAITLPSGAKINVTVFIQWSPAEQVLRKWASLCISSPKPLLLKEVVLDRLQPVAAPFAYNPAAPQSYPVFSNGAFAGIEYPVASSRLEVGATLLAHKPG